MIQVVLLRSNTLPEPTWSSASSHQQLEKFTFPSAYFQPLGPAISSIILGEFITPFPWGPWESQALRSQFPQGENWEVEYDDPDGCLCPDFP